MNLDKLIELTLKNGGASVSFNTGVFNPKVGFFSSFKGHQLIIELEDFTPSKVRALMLPYLIKNKDLIRVNNNFIGTWVNNELVYVDISKQFIYESLCYRFAVNNSQRAYYNAESQEVVNLN